MVNHILNGVLLSWVLSEVEQLWLCCVVHLVMSGDVRDVLTGAEVDTLSVITDRETQKYIRAGAHNEKKGRGRSRKRPRK